MPVPRSRVTRCRIAPRRAVSAGSRPEDDLVEQQDVERAGEAAGQLDQALLARGQRADLHAGQLGDPAQLHGRRRGLLRRAPLRRPGGQLAQRTGAGLGALVPEHDVLGDRERLAERHPLERAAETEPAAHRRGGAGDVAAVQSDPPVEPPVQPAARVEGGGLAGPVRADQAGDPARRRLERQPVDGDEAAEADLQVRHAQPGAPGRGPDGLAVGHGRRGRPGAARVGGRRAGRAAT